MRVTDGMFLFEKKGEFRRGEWSLGTIKFILFFNVNEYSCEIYSRMVC